ncbi:MAG: hypothetical protein LRZ85_04680 [Alphaproteobacteria bacterium]|nr:hypothetical protein [Alphaproteobacteria bacterium]
MEGDTVYDTALSDPRLKMNPAYIPPGTSNWDQWTKDNVRQYSNLAWSGSLGSWMDVGLSGFGLAAFKTLTVKDPDKQIFDVASKLDAIAYKPENTQPISFWSADSLKNNFVTPVTDLLVTVKNDVSDLGGFLSNNTLSLAKDTLTSVPEQSQNLVNYLSGGTITEDIGTWWNSWESLERAKKSDTYQGASTRAEKFLRALPYAANDLAEKATDVFMLPLRGVFKVLEKPSESVAESIRQYGIERGIDGKKAISERLQNYSELPYMAGGLVAFGMSIWMGPRY